MTFGQVLTQEKVYRVSDICAVLDLVRPQLSTVGKRIYDGENGCHYVKYYNVPAAFDIEASSFMYTDKDGHERKGACMYAWTFGIGGAVIMGRTWEEFTDLLDALCQHLKLDENRQLIIYVHNLAYDFQFFRKWLDIDKMFALRERVPIYATTTRGITFRCSYILSTYKLEKIGEDLQHYKVKKLTGDLDYTLIRTHETPLTDEEVGYCVNDVKVVMAYIRECVEEEGGKITGIPLTATGYVRRYCKEKCLPKKGWEKYRYMELMRQLVITSVEEYEQLKNAFQGGFVHASPFYVGKKLHGVTSWDFTSSYPTVMIAEQFPMSAAEKTDIKTKEEFEQNLKSFCCLFDIELYDVEPRLWYDFPLSRSRCRECEHVQTYNGRVTHADRIVTTMTDVDFKIFRKFYKFSKMRVANFRRYERGYLPTPLVSAIIELYKAKTAYKGLPERAVEYARKKGMLNSTYGMTVTDIMREVITYFLDTWGTKDPETGEVLDTYNNSAGRFLFYPWGVWVTAYARRNLFMGIMEAGTDYVYSDTDSVKMLNNDKHIGFIKKYNEEITKRLERALDFHGIPHDAISPKTKDGKEKPLGVWDFDGEYSTFKTLGAKSYLVEYSENSKNGKNAGKISMTVSGLNKGKAVPYLIETYGSDGIWNAFSVGLKVDAEHTGKLTHTYIDDEVSGVIRDYTGEMRNFCEKSCIHLAPQDYEMSAARDFSDFVSGLEDID